MNTSLFLHHLILGNCGSGGTSYYSDWWVPQLLQSTKVSLNKILNLKSLKLTGEVDIWRGVTKEPEQNYRNCNNK